MHLDPELRQLLTGMPLATHLDTQTLEQIRPYAAAPLPGRTAEDFDLVSVLRPDGPVRRDAPCVYWIHGGGMVMGNRFSQIDIPLEWLDRFDAIVVTVGYRLAPEANGTALVDDCYAGLLWTVKNAATDLSGLPPAYVDAGSAEIFRDEVVDYATRLGAAGGRADLHVWSGGFHGFDALFPAAALSAAARATRTGWLARLLA